MQTKPEQVVDVAAGQETPGAMDDVTAKLTAEVYSVYRSTEHQQQLRILEAVLFAASEPLSQAVLEDRLPNESDVETLLADLCETYRGRGVNLVQVSGKWTFRTSEDLSFIMRKDAVEEKRLSRAALETLAIIAYHQPVARSEIEEVRGVSISKGTLDALLEIGWIRMRGRRRSPGRPVTYGTSDAFLSHFGLEAVSDLPGMSDLKAAGLLQSNLPSDFVIPAPGDGEDLDPDEDPLDEGPDMDDYDEPLEAALGEDAE